MKLPRRLQPFAAAAITVLLACSRASSPLPTHVGKSLTVTPRPAGTPVGFAVVFAGPTGPAAPESELQILFSRPLRAMTTLADAPPPTISIHPPIEGRWRWLGTQALVFSPAQQRLPFGTEIEIEVPAETRALDGTPLKEAYRWRMRTPAPKLVDASATDDAAHLRENSRFELLFDQPVDMEPLRRSLRLEVTQKGASSSYPFQLSVNAKRMEGQGYLLVPQRQLPRAANVRLVVERGLAGREGSLTTVEEQFREFATIAPLRIEKWDCDRATPKHECDARGGVSLEFSNSVPLRRLRPNITIDGRRAKLASWHSDDDVTSYVHLPGPFRAGSSVTLRVAGSTRDEFDQALGRHFTTQVVFDDFFPRMEIGLQGQIFEATQPVGIPIGMVNVERYERLYVPLSAEALAPLLGAESSDQLFAKGLALQGARLDTLARKNRANELGIDSFTPLGKAGPWLGAALVALRYPGVNAEGKPISLTDARFVQRTNLGLSGQVGRHASVLWVTELDSGNSASDVEVSVLQSDGQIRIRAKTDGQGIVRFGANAIPAQSMDQPFKHPAAFVVKRGDDMAFRRISDLMPEWNVPVSVDRSGQLDSKMMLFTERGLYRPGERVDVKVILRDERARGLVVPTPGNLKLELLTPANHAVASKTVKTSEFGTAAAHFGIPLSGMTGQWSVQASRGKVNLGSTPITVGEYRSVDLEVRVVPEKTQILRGGMVAATVRAKTLFGMAANGAKTRIEAYRERTSFVPPGAEGYVTDASDYDELHRNDAFPRAQLLLTSRELDRDGVTAATVSAELPAARGPEWIHIEAEVTDASQNPVAAAEKILVHPAEYYVGLRRLNERWLTAPSRVRFDVAAFGIDGVRRAERSVELQLIRRKWSIVRREVNGVVQTGNEPRDDVVGRCQVRTAVTDVHCGFDISQAGSYFVVARSKDDQQRVATAAQAFFAVGPGQPEVADADDHRVELVPDQSEYRVGDVAKILVKSAITEVDALVVVGRSDIHFAERRRLTGATPIIEVPIREDMRPNMFVTVQLVTGRKRSPPARLEQADLGAPTFRLGWAELNVGSSDRRLTVELHPSTRSARPGANVDLNVTLRDQQARPIRGEVTLWAVDEGVLALGDYRVPDPYSIFLGPRPLQLLPLESREDLGRRTLAGLREELGLSKGTSGAGGGESPAVNSTRHDFRATAFFLPDLVTDPEGKVKATLKLPDGLTTYRVFAVAVTGAEQYGFASERIVTSKPLMVRPTVPRFFRHGDRAEVGVVISAQDLAAEDTTIDLQATGLLPRQQRKTTRILRGGSVEVSFPLTAPAGDAGELTVEARSGRLRDSVKLSRPIRYAIPEEVVAQAGETRDRALEKIGDLGKVRSDLGYLELRLSNGFLGGASGGFRQLVEYPYGCTEQISSRLMALLPLADLASNAGIDLPKDRDRMVDVAVAELSRRQRNDGGFGMWPGASHSESWVSAHTMAALLDAKRGRSSLAPVLERGVDYLHRIVAAFGVQTSDIGQLAGMAYAVDVLYRAGKGDPGTLSRLFEKRRELPVFAQAMLLHAYALSRHDAEAIAEQVGELERLIHQDGASASIATNEGSDYARLFDSNTRTAALTTWALAAARPEHPLLVPLARGLLATRREGHWATTQESAFALLALDAVRKAKRLSSIAIEAEVNLGARQLFSGNIGGSARSMVVRRVPMATLQQGDASLLLAVEHGPLLYEARLAYVPKEPPTLALDAGFAIERSFLPVGPDGNLSVEPSGMSTTQPCVLEAARGQSFVVELTVVVPRPRDFVVVDVPLPAGFEAIDVTHRTSSGWMRRLERIDGIGSEGSPSIEFHRELRDDRVEFLVDHFPIGLHRLRFLVRAVSRGDYSLPPARVEAMYAPDIFGTTPACRVRVK